jgi:hypothetical protein
MSERLPTLNKRRIDQLLDEGNLLRYDSIPAKVYIVDQNWKLIGAVRFDTYLRIVKGLKKIKTSSTLHELYMKDTTVRIEVKTSNTLLEKLGEMSCRCEDEEGTVIFEETDTAFKVTVKETNESFEIRKL